jgi:phage baseplate assembly protein W
MNIDFPYGIARDGRCATATDAGHVRDMIELILFTHPGERVMRPDFGAGLLQFVFAANSPEIAAALQLTVRAALAQFLGDLIDVGELRAEAIDAELRVTLSYSLRATGETRADTFVRSVA